jgi:hypothetical protein
MAVAGKKNSTLRETSSRNGRATVMLMGSVGKVRSFKISLRLLLGAAAFFALYIAASILVIHQYFELYAENRGLRESLSNTKEALPKNEKELLKSRHHIALLEDHIKNLEQAREKESRPPEAQKPKDPAKKVEQPVLASPAESGWPEEIEALPSVAVEDMVVQKEGVRMTVNFRLVNTQQGEIATGGYIHVIATNRKNEKLQAWAYPAQELQDGMPIDFRRGQPFLIQRFKQIQGRFNLGSNTETPTSIKVLAYNHSGKLVLQKEHVVGNAP